MTNRPRNADERTPDTARPNLTGKAKAQKDARRERLAMELRRNLERRKRQQREREDGKRGG